MAEILSPSTEGPVTSIGAYRDGPLGPYLTAKRLRDLNHAPGGPDTGFALGRFGLAPRGADEIHEITPERAS